jgi:hypothetical protein
MTKKLLASAVIVLLLVVGLALLGFLAFGWCRQSSRGNKPTATQPVVSDVAVYDNQRLHFSLEYSRRLADVQEQGDSVVFQEDASGPWVMEVSATSTLAASTKEWLNTQPKGGANSAGYEPLLWLDDGTALVTKYEVSDYDGKKPIYNQALEAVHVESGWLHVIDYRNYTAIGQAPTIDPDILRTFSSFKVLVP